jgi:hypothetical protein
VILCGHRSGKTAAFLENMRRAKVKDFEFLIENDAMAKKMALIGPFTVDTASGQWWWEGIRVRWASNLPVPA